MPLLQDAVYPDRYTTLKDQGNSLPGAPPLTAQPTRPHQNTFPEALQLAVLSVNSQFTTTLLITRSTLPLDSSPLDSSPPVNLQHTGINQKTFRVPSSCLQQG